MPSSISSSDTAMPAGEVLVRPGFVRLTASDRPGVAQPVPERDIPSQPWGPILLGAVFLAVSMLAAWEWHWRAFGATPGYRNSDGRTPDPARDRRNITSADVGGPRR